MKDKSCWSLADQKRMKRGLIPKRGWIGVDLDGTLAKFEGWRGMQRVGPPVELMLKRVKEWVASGVTVKIFTARVSCPSYNEKAIRNWLKKQGLPEDLEITNVKDQYCYQIWDDIAIQVERSTGRRVDGKG